MNRDPASLHRMYLHRGRLRTKRESVSGVERVLPRARRVVQRNIQRIEVIEIRFDLAIVFNRISESDENVFQTLTQQSDRMPMPRARTTAGLRHVDTFARRALLIYVILETLGGVVERFDQRRFGRLHQLTERRTFLGGNATDQLFGGRERTLLSQVTRAQF